MRLVLVRGYFVYVGNQKIRKSGGYVKELSLVARFGLEHLEESVEPVVLLNFGCDPTPTLEGFVDAIRAAAGIRRSPISIPRPVLIGASYPIDMVARALRIRQPISPVRVRKHYRSTWIDPRRLRELGYVWKYTIAEAFQDWKRENPQDFSC